MKSGRWGSWASSEPATAAATHSAASLSVPVKWGDPPALGAHRVALDQWLSCVVPQFPPLLKEDHDSTCFLELLDGVTENAGTGGLAPGTGTAHTVRKCSVTPVTITAAATLTEPLPCRPLS